MEAKEALSLLVEKSMNGNQKNNKFELFKAEYKLEELINSYNDLKNQTTSLLYGLNSEPTDKNSEEHRKWEHDLFIVLKKVTQLLEIEMK